MSPRVQVSFRFSLEGVVCFRERRAAMRLLRDAGMIKLTSPVDAERFVSEPITKSLWNTSRRYRAFVLRSTRRMLADLPRS